MKKKFDEIPTNVFIFPNQGNESVFFILSRSENEITYLDYTVPDGRIRLQTMSRGIFDEYYSSFFSRRMMNLALKKNFLVDLFRTDSARVRFN